MKFIALICSLLFFIPATFASSSDHHNFAGVFLGGTANEGEVDFSYGLEYEYMLTKIWGLGAVYEKTNNAHHGDGTEVLLASVYLHPYKKFKLLRLGLGLGKEKIGGAHSHTENLSRVSLSIDFHVANFYIVPTLAADFVAGNTTTVFGVAIMTSF